MKPALLEIELQSTGWQDHMPTCVIEINNRVEYNEVIAKPTNAVVELNDAADKTHIVRIHLRNKCADDTEVDKAGNIVNDVLLHINDIKLNGISINTKMYHNPIYVHNKNRDIDRITDQYVGVMGFNGYIELLITSPAAMWIAEILT